VFTIGKNAGGMQLLQCFGALKEFGMFDGFSRSSIYAAFFCAAHGI
jgi:hypothetical protein